MMRPQISTPEQQIERLKRLNTVLRRKCGNQQKQIRELERLRRDDQAYGWRNREKFVNMELKYRQDIQLIYSDCPRILVWLCAWFRERGRKKRERNGPPQRNGTT